MNALHSRTRIQAKKEEGNSHRDDDDDLEQREKGKLRHCKYVCTILSSFTVLYVSLYCHHLSFNFSICLREYMFVYYDTLVLARQFPSPCFGPPRAWLTARIYSRCGVCVGGSIKQGQIGLHTHTPAHSLYTPLPPLLLDLVYRLTLRRTRDKTRKRRR